MKPSKANTIPDEILDQATLSAWLRGMPISERCKRLYPDIVSAMQHESCRRVAALVVQEYGESVAA